MKKLKLILLFMVFALAASSQTNTVIKTKVNADLINGYPSDSLVFISAITQTIINSTTKIPSSASVYTYINSVNNVYEKELTNAETNIPVGFTINSTSLVFLNGGIIKKTQWSGEGTNTIVLTLNTKQYDNLLIKQ